MFWYQNLHLFHRICYIVHSILSISYGPYDMQNTICIISHATRSILYRPYSTYYHFILYGRICGIWYAAYHNELSYKLKIVRIRFPFTVFESNNIIFFLAFWNKIYSFEKIVISGNSSIFEIILFTRRNWLNPVWTINWMWRFITTDTPSSSVSSFPITTEVQSQRMNIC